MKVYLLTGLAGSGKTFFAKEFSETNGLRYLSIDDIYSAVLGPRNKHNHRHIIWDIMMQAIDLAVEDGVDIIIDTNAPRVADRLYLFDILKNKFDETYLIYIDAPVELCISNNANRSRVIENTHMQRIIDAYEPPISLESDKWTKIYHVLNNNNQFQDLVTMDFSKRIDKEPVPKFHIGDTVISRATKFIGQVSSYALDIERWSFLYMLNDLDMIYQEGDLAFYE